MVQAMTSFPDGEPKLLHGQSPGRSAVFGLGRRECSSFGDGQIMKVSQITHALLEYKWEAYAITKFYRVGQFVQLLAEDLAVQERHHEEPPFGPRRRDAREDKKRDRRARNFVHVVKK